MTRKEVFKLGFITKLAQEKITPSMLVDGVEKLAAATAEPAKADAKPAAKGDDKGLSLKSMLTTGLLLGGGVPNIAGRAIGGVATNAIMDQLDTPLQMRKKYLLKKYHDLIEAEKVKQNNALISQALQA